MRHRLLLCLLLPSLLLAQEAPPTFDGRSVAEWRELLSSNDLSHRDVLVAGGARALPMLRVLIRSKEDYVPWRALYACEELGPVAAPLSDDLLRILREEDDEWIKQNSAARALYNLGRRDQAFVEQLARHALFTTKRSLRSTCIDKLAAMKVDVASRVFIATSLDEAHAASVLARVGESCIPTLVEACRREGRERRIAVDALFQIGWPAVTPLERADLCELAQQVLEQHPLHHVPMHDYNELRTKGGAPFEQPAVDRAPEMVWWQGVGNGYRFSLFRATEGPTGTLVRKLELIHNRRKKQPAQLEVTTFVVPRARALDAARQLAAIRRLELRHDDSAMSVSTQVSGDGSWGGARIVQDGRVLLDEQFAGKHSTRNAARRFHAQATIGVLQAMLHGQAERAADFGDSDRELLDELSRKRRGLKEELAGIRAAAAKRPARREQR